MTSTREYYRNKKKVWFLSSALLVPLSILLAFLVGILIQYLGFEPLKFLSLPVGLLGLLIVSLFALPLLSAWTIAALITHRGKPDIIIDDEGVHAPRIPLTVRWSNLTEIQVGKLTWMPSILIKVKSIDEALIGVPSLLQTGMRKKGNAIEIPTYFIAESAYEIVKTIHSSWTAHCGN